MVSRNSKDMIAIEVVVKCFAIFVVRCFLALQGPFFVVLARQTLWTPPEMNQTKQHKQVRNWL